MNHDDALYCWDCDATLSDWDAFLAHANAGHAITQGAPTASPR